MATTKEFIQTSDVSIIAEDYTKGLNGKVDKEENKGLYPNADATKLSGIQEGAEVNTITAIEVNGTAATISDKKASVTIDAVTSATLNNYVQKEGTKGLSTNDYDNDAKAKVEGALQESDLQSKLEELDILDEDTITSLIEGKIEKVGIVQGSCTKTELATKKATANNQDIWIVTDDDNHLYMFVGEGKPGATDGFVDLGGHYDLSNLAEKSYVDSKTEGVLKEDDLTVATRDKVLAAIATGKQNANQA